MNKSAKFLLLLLLLGALCLKSTGFTLFFTRKNTLSVASEASLFAKKKNKKKASNKKTPAARGNRFASGFGNDAYNQVEDAKAVSDDDAIAKLNALFKIDGEDSDTDKETEDFDVNVEKDETAAARKEGITEASSSGSELDAVAEKQDPEEPPSSLVDLIEIPKDESPSVSNILEPTSKGIEVTSPEPANLEVSREHRNDAKEEDIPEALVSAILEATETTENVLVKEDEMTISDAAVEDKKVETQLIDEAARILTDRYAQECLQEQHRRKEIQAENGASTAARRRQLVQVSESPLIFTIDEFLNPDQCRRVQNDATGCYDLLYPEKLSDEIFNGQESELDGLLFNLASSDDHVSCDGAYPDGLHVDTNNHCLNRHVTCILYLNDIPEKCGGATVFPLARTLDDDPALEAARRLLKGQVSHTRRQTLTKSLQADASLIESRFSEDYLRDPATATAVKIQRKAGKLLIFFSRDADGQEDPRAWHAGEKIVTNTGSVQEKRILTLFKEVDYTGRPNAPKKPSSKWSPLEDYFGPMVAEQRQWLMAKAKLQRALLEFNQDDETGL